MRDHAACFLRADPPSRDGMPDSSLMIGVAFEVAGLHETWGYVVYRRRDLVDGRWRLERLAEGKTMEEATTAARWFLKLQAAA